MDSFINIVSAVSVEDDGTILVDSDGGNGKMTYACVIA
jgi:hypothetical protein